MTKCNVGETTRYSGDIFPLTGLISAHKWSNSSDGREPPFVDADNVATLLHTSLGTRGKLHLLSRSITSGRLPPIRTRDAAVIGVGALGGGHRLKDSENLDDVRKVRPLLEQINTLAETVEGAMGNSGLPFYHPVGDVCNYYFVVEKPGSVQMATKLRTLQKYIEELNDKFMKPEPKSLAQIVQKGMVVAIAGGPHKAAALLHVLRGHREGQWISHLVTDRNTAAWLLRAVEDDRNVSQPIP